MFKYINYINLLFWSLYALGIFRRRVRAHGFFTVGNARNIEIGGGVSINAGVYIQGRNHVIIGNNVVISRSVMIFDAGRSISQRDLHDCKSVSIGDRCWIGAGAIILPGVVLGDDVIVGAGSVVTKSFSSCSVIAGNPAKVVSLAKSDE